MERANKITLFIMTSKGFSLLAYIVNKFSAAIIDQVITSRDKNLTNDYNNEIISFCGEHNIPVSDRKENIKVNTEFTFAVSWRWLINLRAENKLIVFHDSLLPRYRGFAPLVNALINKEPEIGVTALFASNKYDRGDIIAQSATAINYPLSISDAIELNNENYFKLATSIIHRILGDEVIVAHPQDESRASYSLWRDEYDYRIVWEEDSEKILRLINSLSAPYKGASSFLNGTLVRIKNAETVPDVRIENRTPGKVIFIEQGCPIIVCGIGLLKITKLVAEDGLNLLPLKTFRIRFS